MVPKEGNREYRAWLAGLVAPVSLLSAPPSGVTVALLPLGGGAGAVVPMGGNWEYRAWLAGLVAPVSLLSAPPPGVTVALLPLGGGAGLIAPMGGSRESDSKFRGLRILPLFPSFAFSP